ncbi:TRAP transporter small permease [Vallitalea guaymasensis]|uniref:TRAP transporter small permease n=1 Tax=Vallitalea guaymasensis TaxID=1185412 RepID=UPI00272D025A|nr:TRAP transporter small permease [Vallitalea guaymasensis]
MKNILKKLDSSIENLVFACTIGFVAISFLQVIFRYIINNSLSWSEEACRYLFVCTVFLGSSLAILKNKHIGVDILARILPKSIEKYFTILLDLIVVVYLIFLSYISFELALKNMNQLSPAMQLHLGIVYLIMPIGSVVMAINFIRVIIYKFTRDKDWLGKDEDLC